MSQPCPRCSGAADVPRRGLTASRTTSLPFTRRRSAIPLRWKGCSASFNWSKTAPTIGSSLISSTGGAFGSDEEAVEDVVIGALDVVLGAPAVTPVSHPQVQTWLLPYLFDDEAHLQEAISGPIARDFFKGLEWHGIQGLAFWHGGFRGLGTRGQAVAGVDDVAGSPSSGCRRWTCTPRRGPRWVHSPLRCRGGTCLSSCSAGTSPLKTGRRTCSAGRTCTRPKTITASSTIVDGLFAGRKPLQLGAAPHGHSADYRRRDRSKRAAGGRGSSGKRRQSDALAAMEKAGVSVERSPDVTGFRKQAHALYGTLQDKPWYDAKLVARIRGLAAKEDK